MAPITITVVDGGGREHTKMLSSEDGYNRVLREFAVLFLVLDLENGKSAAIEDFGEERFDLLFSRFGLMFF